MVRSVKDLIKKAKHSDADVHLALLCFRSTPVDNTIPSPGELLSGRKFQNNVFAKIKNTVSVKDEVRTKLLDRQVQQKLYHDRNHGVRDLPQLLPGQ